MAFHNTILEAIRDRLALGQKAKAASLPVVFASDQDALNAKLLGADSNPLAPNAAALAAAMANPTTTQIGADLLGFNGTGWDRLRLATANAATMGTVGILGAAGVVYDGGTGYIPVRNAASTPDGGAGTWFPPALGAVYNETTFDRLRGVVARTLLASAERTATTSSADQTNYNWRGIRVDTNISAITDAGAEIVVALQAKDPVSGNYIVLVQTVALNTTGQKAALIAFPGAIVAANEVANTLVPRTWNVKVTHTDAKRISYSVVCSLIP